MKHFLKLKQLFPLLVVIFTMAVMIPGSGTMEAQKAVGTTDGLEVTIHVFSGRQNPVFVISDEGTLTQFEELVNKSKVADRFEKSTVIPSILGYNGIVVKLVGDPGVFPGLETLAVYDGYIEKKITDIDDKSSVTVTFLIDEGSAVEDFLLNLALDNGTLDQKIYDFIKKK